MSGEVGRDEFEALKIKVAVMENAVKQLTEEVALLREDMNARFDQMNDRFDRADQRFLDFTTEMRRQLTEFQANVVAAVITSGKPSGET